MAESPRPSLVRRTLSSISWNFMANMVQLVMGFTRTTLLARMLPVEIFGVYSMAHSWVTLSSMLPNFGMGGAFIHRAPETEDEEHTARTHFTLQMLFTAIWTILMAAGSWIFAESDLQTALLALTAYFAVMQFVHTPRLILARRVEHRRLALIGVVDTTLSTAAALALAMRGETLWALLASNIVAFSVNVLFLYVWRPIWRPRFNWSPQTMRYFLGYGVRNVMSDALLRALDRFDDLWTGLFLGETPLGYYSRAYAFATYPRQLLAVPVNLVTGGAYAELKGDRKRLSQAFVRVNGLLTWTGFLLAGGLWLVSPEFVRIVLGEKWLPMLQAFRLMLVYTLFDPIKITISSLFMAMGEPGKNLQIRGIQLMVLVAGLFLLGPAFGIAGVALAVDVMLVVGIVLFLRRARTHVDFSWSKLFVGPVISLVFGLFAGIFAGRIPIVTGSDWASAGAKLAAFSVIYVATLVLLQRKDFESMAAFVRTRYAVIRQGKGPSSAVRS
ncbi:MAG: oligosaccharide flippase family protein [Anaerolineae bacterium]|nr:oligosaccharide flippase family protein [Anaerolineae bacterium]